MFYRLENEIGEEWCSSLSLGMIESGKREKEYAVSNGDLCLDGTPCITVYVDGSWSKRSYGTNFNALSGMVGIVGRHTGELLFAGVRNKFCSICERAKNNNTAAESRVL
ncbi:hypothetical protein RN001_009605 [Aquatica leii]|uniref:Mutator-like transposase domain-containing protein n=1 Tax=Aquatica leii TaxID=1421715 RepID=A0AAN7PTX8_9COLE|nr:hypothetical protein RN001_009605 [Aquatica leii]